MEDVTRRDALKMAAVVGTVVLGGSGAAAASQEDRTLAYGNRGQWRWWRLQWWWVMDHDHRFPVWDRRGRCGDTAEVWIKRRSIAHVLPKGHCLNLPGKPPWYEVKLRANVTVGERYAADADAFTVEKAEEMELGPPDTSAPGEAQEK